MSKSGQRLLDRSWVQQAGVLTPILLVYFFLAFYHIEYQSLWLDEVITVLALNREQSFLAGDRWFGARGPLYPVLIQLWPKWGNVEFAFRSLSVMLGGISVCLAYMVARRLYDQSAAWVSTILFATSPFHIWYSQEARYVNLAIATALLAMYTFQLALSNTRKFHWVLYCCNTILALAAFVGNLLLPLSQALYLLCTESGRHRLAKSLVPYLAVFFIFAWWANNGHINEISGYWLRLPVSLPISSVTPSPRQPADSIVPLNTGGGRESNLFELPYTFFAFSTGFSLGPSTRELQVSPSLTTVLPHMFTVTLLGVFFGGLFIGGIASLWSLPDKGQLLAFSFAGPVLGTFATAAIIPGLTYNVRYACAAFPAYLFIIAAGILRFRLPSVRMALLAAVLLVNAVSLSNYYYDPRYAREDARGAAKYLQVAAKPGDVILTVGNPMALQYYYKGEIPLRLIDARHQKDSTALGAEIGALLGNHDRVWLVGIRRWERDPAMKVKAAFEDLGRPEKHQEFAGIEIHTYNLNSRSEQYGQRMRLFQQGS